MEKKVVKKPAAKKKAAEKKEIVAKVITAAAATSPVKKSASKSVSGAVATGAVKKKSPVKKAAKKSAVEMSPAFKTLADPVLPELKRENRARLQMQTPTRLYFYWSIKENPWHLLKAAFGSDTGSYTLALKLTNLSRDTEEIHAADAEGNWWFTVEPDGKYQAEIGFYAPNRPYFRIIYSNTVETPRRSPSPHPASEARWTVSANKFAEVLDVAGFSQDAFDVAMAGDDQAAAENATHTAFSRFIGANGHSFDGIADSDIRYAMIALASGATLEDLRFKISPALFAILQANTGKLVAASAMSALTEYFDIDEAEWIEEQFGSAVYGASLVNFPRTLKTRTASARSASRYSPVSSHSLR